MSPTIGATAYTLLSADKTADGCDGDSCLNGATCIDEVNAYSCSCVAGYTGDRCETGMLEYHDIRRCSSPTSVTYKANLGNSNYLGLTGVVIIRGRTVAYTKFAST